MEKIDLDGVKDKHKLKDLALLFDRPDFQKDLQELKRVVKKDNENHKEMFSFLFNAKGYGTARDLVQKYKYPLGFTRAIYYAACFGKVTHEDVADCYSAIVIHPASVLDEYKPTLTKNDFVISISPYGIKGNIQIILNTIRIFLKKASKDIKPLSKNHPLNKDVIPEIQTKRDWYWERKLKKTETKELMKTYHSTRNTIDKAISDYSKLLQSEF